MDHFPDLGAALDRLEIACRNAELVAICGDYDADGITSTALMLGVLQRLGQILWPQYPAGKKMATGSMLPWWKGSQARAAAY